METLNYFIPQAVVEALPEGSKDLDEAAQLLRKHFLGGEGFADPHLNQVINNLDSISHVYESISEIIFSGHKIELETFDTEENGAPISITFSGKNPEAPFYNLDYSEEVQNGTTPLLDVLGIQNSEGRHLPPVTILKELQLKRSIVLSVFPLQESNSTVA